MEGEYNAALRRGIVHIIAGKFHRRELTAPKGDATRPTSARLREAFFNIVQGEIEGADFLDIFAGSGAMGLEALSRGARRATFIESSRMALNALETNLARLNAASDAQVLFGDYLKMLKRLQSAEKQFDIIFADAPYSMTNAVESLLEMIGGGLLKPGGLFFMENRNPLPTALDLRGLSLINSRKSGNTYLHQFVRR
jgi:16S rRNA (guanine966-N2)-methyltransferase